MSQMMFSVSVPPPSVWLPSVKQQLPQVGPPLPDWSLATHQVCSYSFCSWGMFWLFPVRTFHFIFFSFFFLVRHIWLKLFATSIWDFEACACTKSRAKSTRQDPQHHMKYEVLTEGFWDLDLGDTFSARISPTYLKINNSASLTAVETGLFIPQFWQNESGGWKDKSAGIQNLSPSSTLTVVGNNYNAGHMSGTGCHPPLPTTDTCLVPAPPTTTHI